MGSGEIIYRDYDQRGLDAQYDNRARCPNFKAYLDDWKRWSAASRAAQRAALDLAFGPAPAETLDVFPADCTEAPICVFIHGGYWSALDKSDFSYIAEGLRPHGFATAVINYGLAPIHAMDEIVRQNRAALAWLWRHAVEYGGDPARIYVGGHSAGGHLGAMLLVTDWPTFAPDLPADLVKGACSLSGIFDLEPIRLSYLNATLHLTPEQVAAYSPLRLRMSDPTPLLLVVGGEESDEYHRQSREMEEIRKSLGYPADRVAPSGFNHFDVVHQLHDPGSAILKRLLAHTRECFATDPTPPR